MRVFLYGIAGIILGPWSEITLFAQEKADAASHQTTLVSVPFIGCRSDGQVGPVNAPKGTSTSMSLSAGLAEKLSYYRSAQGVGVLGPRGWYCFGTYGSSGDALFVSPEPFDTAMMFSAQSRFTGPAIEISHRFGDTSGRFDVAEIIARVFPSYKAFVTGVVGAFDLPANSFSFGPYPRDILTYKGKTVVEFKTPARTDGLGTNSRLKKNDSPIEGVAILIGQTPDLLFLSARLPRELTRLTSAIVQQVERDAANH